MEEKRYAIISRESIRLFAEAEGHSEVTESVAALLAEDATYRLREAVQSSCQYMRHSKRRRLTTEDFNKALSASDVEIIYGQGSGEPSTFRQTAGGELHFVEDREVNLAGMALGGCGPQNPGSTSIKTHWLAVEGTHKGAPTSGGKQNGKVNKGISADLQTYYDNMTMAILGNDDELMRIALEDLRTNARILPLMPYLVNFISQGVRTVSHDVSQLTKLLHTVKAVISNPSLFLEPRPYLNHLVQGIMYCLLEPLAASINPLNDHWALRDYAARLLAQVLNKWSSQVNQLAQKNIKILNEVLVDLTKPPCSHYGTVMGMASLGTAVTEQYILPNLPILMKHLENILNNNTFGNAQLKADASKVVGALLTASESVLRFRIYSYANGDEPSKQCGSNIRSKRRPAPLRIDIPKVISVSQDLNSDSKQKVKSETKTDSQDMKPMLNDELPGELFKQVETKPTRMVYKSYKELYEKLYCFFGDCLSTRLPVAQIELDQMPKKTDNLVSLADSDSLKSGEDLLAVFLNTADKMEADSEHTSDKTRLDEIDIDGDVKSEPSEPSDKSDENLLFLGEDTSNVDLTVKSTNDSSKGIKLIISKRPKRKHESKERKSDKYRSDSKEPKHKRRKQNVQSSKEEQMFEKTVLRKREGKFVFNIRGLSAVAVLDPAKKFSIDSDNMSYKTPVYKQNLCMPVHGKMWWSRRPTKILKSNAPKNYSTLLCII
ncbi:TAF6-like RNA polymerase II p300/CBP-associated factor-associated factor 65 kDa subunit 6L [Lingula anatina]|uniref:Histone H4 n=1 Tax=Lingula anatina TaxID=7574 RepID=A0A1S3J8P1_LINAN|nr:TAF6-like RNA polymerase II p300/CBP-associated factor-associated factor 65 kDa subunit 6L [Lingula anatina]|eukprot:XP_013406678.1 TAF6-like RNA polymerase II p300/CBP-associated factor-associated factor 65 kDa subunit 6L [Lingula anatina]